MTLQADVDRHVALKRHLGFKFVNNERMLHSWAAFAMARGDDVIVADTMFDWARDASSPAFARKRLSVGRRFAVWLHAENERHEVPHNNLLGPTTQRRPPPAPVDQRRDQVADGGRAVAPAEGLDHAPYLALHHRIDGHHRSAPLTFLSYLRDDSRSILGVEHIDPVSHQFPAANADCATRPWSGFVAAIDARDLVRMRRADARSRRYRP